MRGTLAVALLLCGAALALGGSDELLAQAQVGAPPPDGLQLGQLPRGPPSLHHSPHSPQTTPSARWCRCLRAGRASGGFQGVGPHARPGVLNGGGALTGPPKT